MLDFVLAQHADRERSGAPLFMGMQCIKLHIVKHIFVNGGISW